MNFRASFFVLLAFAAYGQEDPQAQLKQADAALDGGQYAVAVEKAQRAAASFKKSGNAEDQARAITTAGLAQMYSGDYAAAIANFEDALGLARDVHDFGPEIARLNDIGNALYFRGQYGEAMAKYEEAQARIRAVPNDQWSAWGRQLTTANIAILYQTIGQNDRALALYTGLLKSAQTLEPFERAQMLANIGVLRRRLGDPQKALETYRAAQALYRRSAHRDGEIAVLNNTGIVQVMDLNDLKGAESTFTEALKLAEASGNRPLMVHAHIYRGEAIFRAGRQQQAGADFQVAGDLAKALGQQEEEWKALYGLSRVARARGDMAEGKRLLQDAVKAIESLRLKAGGAELRSTFLADKRAVYDLLIQDASSASEVFHWMEESRARTLRDKLGISGARPLEEIQREVQVGTLILEYWIGEHSAAVLWITREQTGFERFKWSEQESAAVEGLVAAMSDPGRADWRELSGPVTPWLLGMVRPILEQPSIRRLEIVPDGVLAKLPFEALPFTSSELLVERFVVSYAPSMRASAERAAGARFRWPWQRSLTALADPAAGSPKGSAGLEANRGWSALPQTRTEVAEIGQVLGGRSEVHEGADARKVWLTGKLAPVLHLATHALADAQNPDLSYILLAPNSADQRWGYLFLKEVEGLPLSKVDLVTLSACETNVGKFVPGEGIQSFSSALVSAGARSVVASLWKVGDRSTAELMVRFYEALAGGMPVADALREAKLQFVRSPQSAHPAHWAAFVLSGDSDWELPRLIRWWWMAAALCLAALLAVALLRLKGR